MTTDYGVFVFPWDILGAHTEQVLEWLQEVGIRRIFYAASYHAALDIVPHHPRAVLVHQPHWQLHFTPDASIVESAPWLIPISYWGRQTDNFEKFLIMAQRSQLEVAAWTVVTHDPPPDSSWIEGLAENAFGDMLPFALCPAKEEVRAFGRFLVRAVLGRGFSSVLAESVGFETLPHGAHHERAFVALPDIARFLLSVCFCPSCLERAARFGVDGERTRNAVKQLIRDILEGRRKLGEYGLELVDVTELVGNDFDRYLLARASTVTEFIGELAGVARSTGIPARFEVIDLGGALLGYAHGRPPKNRHPLDEWWRTATDPMQFYDSVNAVAVLAYAASARWVQSTLEKYLERLGTPEKLHVVFRPMPPDCSSEGSLFRKLKIARRLGLRYVSFYHYGLMAKPYLDRLRAVLRRAASG